MFYVIHLFYVLNRLTLKISSPGGILKNYYRCMQVSVWHRSSRRQHVFSFACVRIRYRGYECVYVCVYMRACVRRCEREYTYTNIYFGTSMLSSFCHFWTALIDPDTPYIVDQSRLIFFQFCGRLHCKRLSRQSVFVNVARVAESLIPLQLILYDHIKHFDQQRTHFRNTQFQRK